MGLLRYLFVFVDCVQPRCATLGQLLQKFNNDYDDMKIYPLLSPSDCTPTELQYSTVLYMYKSVNGT